MAFIAISLRLRRAHKQRAACNLSYCASVDFARCSYIDQGTRVEHLPRLQGAFTRSLRSCGASTASSGVLF